VAAVELRTLLEVAKLRGWILIVTVVVAAASAWYVSNQLTPTYQASTTLLVNQTQAPGVVLYNDILTSERLTNTYARLVEQRPILSAVRAQLTLPFDEEELRRKLSVAPIRNTQLLRISVEDKDPEAAAKIANVLADVFIADNAQKLGSRPGTVSVSEPAIVADSPVKPNVLLNTVLAGMLGLMLGAAVAAALEYLDDTIKDARDVEVVAGLTTLGTVARFSSVTRNGKNWGRVGDALDRGAAEDYRQIRTNIHFSMLDVKSKVILVTSTAPVEGKSTTASNLAIVLGRAGHKVILIDADLRRPSIHRLFRTPNTFGLTGLLLSQSKDINFALFDTDLGELKVMPSGPLPPNPSEVLMSSQFAGILLAARDKADYVILDSPPVLAVTDARVLAGQADATILVVEPAKERSGAFQRTCQALGQANAKILGVIFNKVKARRKGYYYGYYRSQHQESQPVSANRTETEADTAKQPVS
jgi:polysaccharide biosynthesis transport protein